MESKLGTKSSNKPLRIRMKKPSVTEDQRRAENKSTGRIKALIMPSRSDAPISAETVIMDSNDRRGNKHRNCGSPAKNKMSHANAFRLNYSSLKERESTCQPTDER